MEKQNFFAGILKQPITLLLVQLPASENYLSEYTEDDGEAIYFLAKLASCGYFVLFVFHQFKTLSSFISAFKFTLAIKPFIFASISSSQNPVA